MATILNFLLQQAIIILIKGYNKFGKAKAYRVIDEFYSELDKRLSERLGKESASKVENELIELLEEKIKAIRKDSE
jgi:hypothetical protein